MYNLKIFYMTTFYIAMVLFGALYAVLVTNPKNEKESRSFSMRYPLLGVFAFFALMMVIYYLLNQANKSVGHTYFGTLALAASFFLSAAVYKKLNRK